MKITVIGAGYVGLVTGTCLAEVGHEVVVLESDLGRVSLLQANGVPIHEPGLEELIPRNAKHGRLHFSSSATRAFGHADVIFIAVGTPPLPNGNADLSYVMAAAESIGRLATTDKLVVIKSTVSVGTSSKVARVLQDAQAQHRKGDEVRLTVASNPEFLREGNAIGDFLRPDRVVVGLSTFGRAHAQHDQAVMAEIYEPLVQDPKQMHWMDCASAELTKYASNAMLACRISFVNQLAQFADQVNADIACITEAMGADRRIGPSFLQAGVGYGGSCFPKDTAALLFNAQTKGVDLTLVEQTIGANLSQRDYFLNKITTALGSDLTGKRIAVWGLAFKPNTNDMRFAPSRVIIPGLLERGAEVHAFDPVAGDEARRLFAKVLQSDANQGGQLVISDDMYEPLSGAHALVTLTEWPVFAQASLADIAARLGDALVFDGRNQFDPENATQLGVAYIGVGRRNALGLARLVPERERVSPIHA